MATTTKETKAREVDAYNHSEVERLNTIAVGASAYYVQEKPETVHYDASKADPNIEVEWSGKTEGNDNE